MKFFHFRASFLMCFTLKKKNNSPDKSMKTCIKMVPSSSSQKVKRVRHYIQLILINAEELRQFLYVCEAVCLVVFGIESKYRNRNWGNLNEMFYFYILFYCLFNTAHCDVRDTWTQLRASPLQWLTTELSLVTMNNLQLMSIWPSVNRNKKEKKLNNNWN